MKILIYALLLYYTISQETNDNNTMLIINPKFYKDFSIFLIQFEVPYGFNKEIFDYHNKVRKNPAETATKLRDMYNKMSDKTTSYAKATLEAANELANKAPLPEFQWNKDLAKSSKAHVDDMYKNNFMKHESSDGTSAYDRIKKYSNLNYIGENIIYGFDTAEEFMLAWIIDDFDSQRNHRKNIFSSRFTYMGCAYRTNHPTYRKMIVADFGGP